MISFDLVYDFKEFKELTSVFSSLASGAFPNLAATTENAAHQVGQAWRDFLSGEDNLDIKLPEDAKINGKMIQSVKTDSSDGINWSVHSENEQMQKLAQGEPEVKYDMKKTHPYGNKSRVSKKGIPYLIIPFRWGTPNEKGTKRRWNNVIPQKEYRMFVKGLELSNRTNLVHPESNYKGQAIDRSEYNWGGRLKEDTAWDDRSLGMVRMQNGTKSTYFTFRVISAKSPEKSWWYHKDGSSGIDIISALHRKFDDKIKVALEKALAEDEMLLSGGLL